MKRKILQSIGDSILRGLSKANQADVIEFYYEFGMWFNNYCITRHDIYLD